VTFVYRSIRQSPRQGGRVLIPARISLFSGSYSIPPPWRGGAIDVRYTKDTSPRRGGSGGVGAANTSKLCAPAARRHVSLAGERSGTRDARGRRAGLAASVRGNPCSERGTARSLGRVWRGPRGRHTGVTRMTVGAAVVDRVDETESRGVP